MKTASVLLLVTALSLGCQKPQEPAAPPAPKVAGETVIFPDNAPQLAYLSVQAAEPSKRAEVGLYGRLAWDDDVTVRIYSPVGGRVSSSGFDSSWGFNSTAKRAIWCIGCCRSRRNIQATARHSTAVNST